MLRRLHRRFGMPWAPRVTVRAHLSWPWRWLLASLAATLVFGAGWWMYDTGRRIAGFDSDAVESELERLRTLANRLEVANRELSAKAATASQQAEIERASEADLAKQIRALGDENARLKEDLAFFQSLTSAGSKEGTLSLYRFKVERDRASGEYRYGLLIVQNGARLKEFHGSLQIFAHVSQGGQKSVRALHDDRRNPAAWRLQFKSYQRVEGALPLPADARLDSLEVKVMEQGVENPRLTQSVAIS